jgi:hypothetical protein
MGPWATVNNDSMNMGVQMFYEQVLVNGRQAEMIHLTLTPGS